MKNRYKMAGTHKHMRGFEYLMYSAFSTILLFVLVLLPLAPVFADESNPDSQVAEQPASENDSGTQTNSADSTNGDTEDSSSTSVEEQESVDSTIDSDQSEIVDDPQENSSIESAVDTTLIEETLVSDPSQEDSVVTDDPETQESDLISESDSDVDDSVDDTDTLDTETITDDNSDLESVTEETATTVPETELSVIEDDESVEEASLVTEEVLPEAQTVKTNESSSFTFSKSECTAVGDGTYYCAEAKDAPKILHTDRIFSALDEDGDKEIYAEKDGEIIPITSNTVDDDAPYFDDMSNTIVWHRLIDGRYQIISYDIDEKEETQITFDRFNNMEPKRFGDITVWQGWVGEDWEIFMLDGDMVTMFTDNTEHDITPSINGSHIVWQAFESGAWKMKVYDLRTKKTETIEDAEGGSIQNPRFVLVYDTTLTTGDVETRGYDLESGEVVPLSSTPAPMPTDLPDPDQTGEDRALISQVLQPKPKTDDDTDDDIDSLVPPVDSDIDTEFDIVIPPLATSTETLAEDLEVSAPTTTPNSDTATETEIGYEHIEDLIVTPYVEEAGVTESDPQAPIAN